MLAARMHGYHQPLVLEEVKRWRVIQELPGKSRSKDL
jgi:hypothetical protein